MKRVTGKSYKDRFTATDVPSALFEEMKANATEVFQRNLQGWGGSMDHALAATYLDGVLTGALFVLERGPEGLKALVGERP